MKPVRFDEVNLMLAEDQPEYETLPVHVGDAFHKPVTFCFEPTVEELSMIIRTRKIWIQQLTYGQPFQPILITATKPEMGRALPSSNSQLQTSSPEATQ